MRTPSIKMPESIHELIGHLADSDQEVRLCAALNLGSMGENADEAVPALLEMLESDNSLERRVAVVALGDIAATEAIPALLSHARDKDSVVRLFVSQTLQDMAA